MAENGAVLPGDEGEERLGSQRGARKPLRVMDMSIIFTVMIISWGHRYAKCIRFYTLNMYSLFMLTCSSNHFPDNAYAAGQGPHSKHHLQSMTHRLKRGQLSPPTPPWVGLWNLLERSLW